MPIKIDRPHLENISKYIRKMMTYTEDVTFEEFQENQMVYDACVLNFINLAESFKLLSDNFKVKNPTLPYHQIKACAILPRTLMKAWTLPYFMTLLKRRFLFWVLK